MIARTGRLLEVITRRTAGTTHAHRSARLLVEGVGEVAVTLTEAEAAELDDVGPVIVRFERAEVVR